MKGGHEDTNWRCRFPPHWDKSSWIQAAGLVRVIVEARNRLGGGGRLRMVELGSAKGESGTMFAASGLFEKVWCIDLWENGSNKGIASKNLSKFPCAEMIQGDAHEIAKNWGEPLDVIYLDAEHTYEATMLAFHGWGKWLRPGGLWAGHDYSKAWPGVIQAVDEFFAGRERLDFVDSSWMIVPRY
jgi:predicted O-methyltransferase YrrM